MSQVRSLVAWLSVLLFGGQPIVWQEWMDGFVMFLVELSRARWPRTVPILTRSNLVFEVPQSLRSEEGFFDVVFFKWFWILENPGKILSKSFMSLSWTCFALALIFVQTLCCFQWVHCMTSVFTRWNLEQQPPGVTGENWEKVSFF